MPKRLTRPDEPNPTLPRASKSICLVLLREIQIMESSVQAQFPKHRVPNLTKKSTICVVKDMPTT